MAVNFFAPQAEINFEEKDHFLMMTRDRMRKTKRWVDDSRADYKGEPVVFTDSEEMILNIVSESNVRPFFIAKSEPMIKGKKLGYASNQYPAVGYSVKQYQKMAEQIVPGKSGIATLTELLIYYLDVARLGCWSLKDMFTEVSKLKSYQNEKHVDHGLETTCFRAVFAFRNGIGNTKQLVTHNGQFLEVGVAWDEKGTPLTMKVVSSLEKKLKNTCPVVVVRT